MLPDHLGPVEAVGVDELHPVSNTANCSITAATVVRSFPAAVEAVEVEVAASEAIAAGQLTEAVVGGFQV